MIDIWNVPSIEAAKKVILTGDTEKRWEESHWEASRLTQYMPFAANVLDFGCGIGRLSKELLAIEPDIHVVGVDSSESMRKLAVEYVNSDRFEVMESVAGTNRHFDFAVYSLVLQHMPIDDYFEALYCQDAPFIYIHNLHKRRVWGGEQYYDDGMQTDLMGLIDKYYRLIHSLPAEECHFAGIYKRR